MTLKKVFTDPSVILLLASNVFCLWFYQKNPEGFSTIIWIYWGQSVMLGLFNFLDIISLRNFAAQNATVNGKPAGPATKGCLAFFFLFHYGMFHVIYSVFIMIKQGMPEMKILAIAMVAFLMESLILFRRKKIYERDHVVNVGALIFLPYVRIVPMHLVILVPVFFNISPSIVFLLLKTIADISFYVITTKMYGIRSSTI